jgi:hypothetical protein
MLQVKNIGKDLIILALFDEKSSVMMNNRVP